MAYEKTRAALDAYHTHLTKWPDEDEGFSACRWHEKELSQLDYAIRAAFALENGSPIVLSIRLVEAELHALGEM